MDPQTLPAEPRNRRELDEWLAIRERGHNGNPPPLTAREWVLIQRLRSGANRPPYSIT